ncbi:MAG TPA: FkbM family methyltransferase [Aestuariivirgaceae bacterium]|nr:FkbM family methyltransferase [Aestuariivirgaceae bacterium]
MISWLGSLIRVRGHTISTAGLGSGAIIVDAGAHRGQFSRALADRFGCRCILVEANPGLAAILSQEFDDVVPAALGPSDGTIRFFDRPNLESGGIVQRQDHDEWSGTVVDQISLPSLLESFEFEKIDVLKLDIEGAELDVLESIPDSLLRRIDQITVEFHDFIPGYATLDRIEQTRGRLEALGFLSCVVSLRTFGDVLFVDRGRFKLSRAWPAVMTAGARLAVRAWPELDAGS